MLQIKFVSTCKIALQWITQNNFDDKIGSGNGSVPSGTVLIQICLIICLH